MAGRMDWPTWRGPEQNGISRETNLPDSWDPTGDMVLWKSEALATRSTPICMEGKLFLLKSNNPASLQEGEKVVCADAVTGEILWENTFNVYLSDVPDTRVGWSTVAGDPVSGNVFAQGVGGVFRCIHGETGETLWEHSMSEEYGVLSTYGGRTNTPVVYEDLVIISGIVIGWGDMAKPAHRFIAFDKRNGVPVWFQSTRLLPEDTTYSTPVITTIGGQTALVFGSGDGGVHALQLRTGKPIWKYMVSARGINTTPIVAADGTVICGHSEENLGSTTMGALFALDGNSKGDITKSGELWRNVGWSVGKTAPLIVDGRVYAVSDFGHLYVADLKTGKEIFQTKIGTQGRSSPIYADGKIYVCEANGRCFIYKVTEDGLEELEAFRLRREDVQGSPIVSHGRIYLPTSKHLYCFGKKEIQPAVDSRPNPVLETDDTASGPAQLQVVPVESLIKPGQKQRFEVRLYSANGLYLKTVPADEVEFSISGPGSFSEPGRFVAATDSPHKAATITAKVGDLTSTARVRIVPGITAKNPWKIDFSAGEVPETWVGIRYRNVHVDFDFLQRLRQEDPMAALLMIFLQSEFVNNGTTNISWDNSTPRQLLNGMYIYLGIRDEVAGLDDAEKLLNASLDRLVAEKFLASYGWENVTGKGPTFRAVKGDRKDDGNIVMMKISTIPKGTRSQGWMGHADFEKYTIQSDVMCFERDGKLGDVGVIAQRYRLELMGARQQLLLYSWVAHEKKFKVVDFPWQGNVWYVMKLRTDHVERDGKQIAVLKGKVWPRDSEEPAEWTIEWEDEPGNTQGSPGLVGNAKDGEVFFDNIIVAPNSDN